MPETVEQTARALQMRVERGIYREFGESSKQMESFRLLWRCTDWSQRAELCASWMRRLTAVEDQRHTPLDI